MTAKNFRPHTARDESVIFAELQKLCRSDGFLHAIAYLCFRDNMLSFEEGKFTSDNLQHQYSLEKLSRNEISTLIGLAVKGSINLDLPKPTIVQRYVSSSDELLKELHFSLQKPWLSAFKSALARDPRSSDPVASPFDTAEGLREPIFYAGESAYNFQYYSLSKEKYFHDREWIALNCGFTIDQACEYAEALAKLQIQKFEKLRNSLRSDHPDDWTMLPAFVFTKSELEQATMLSTECIDRITLAFCIDYNDDNVEFNSLSDFNKTRSNPILRCGSDKYLLFQQYDLLESIYESPFFWMAKDKNYRSTASRNRGVFAERFCAERLKRVFGHQNVFHNVDILRGKDHLSEVDVLVVYGSIAIVLQAKSKRLTIEARKGNDLQLKRDFKAAVQDAYDQAKISADALNEPGLKFISQNHGVLTFSAAITKVYIFCVVSDHFPALAAQSQQFLKTKISEFVNSPIVTDVFFVDIITELLESPLQLLNFLALRCKFDMQLLISQELATLGYHLSQNLWLQENYNMVNIGEEFTSFVDVSMCSRRLGLPGDTIPKGILTRFDGTPIGRLLDQIEAKTEPALVGLGMILLQFSSSAAEHINTGITKLCALALRDNSPHDFSIPSEANKAGITIHVNALNGVDAQERLSVHCKIRKYLTKSDAWYGVLLFPGSATIGGAFAVEGRWRFDDEMEEIVKLWPTAQPVPIETLSAVPSREKVGRNEKCPCGSGLKYKKCCLQVP